MTIMNNFKIYIHLFPNNKIYVGITKQQVENRWKNGLGYVTQSFLYKAIKKYGWRNIQHIVLFDGLDEKTAKNLEVQFIKFFNSNNAKYGYNISNGGDGSFSVSERTRRKISKSVKGKTGHKWTDEQKELARERNKNRCFTEEWKKKISDAKKGSKNAMFGKHWSIEHKKLVSNKIREKSKKRKVYCFETDSIYVSLSECARRLGLSNSKISMVCCGKRKHTHNYHFKYVE